MLFRYELIVTVLVFEAVAVGCSPSGGASVGAGTRDADVVVAEGSGAGTPACAPFSEVTGPLPDVDPKHLTLDFWLEQLSGQYDLDQVLLTPEQIRTLNASLQVPREEYHAQRDLLEPLELAELVRDVDERRVWARNKLASGEYVSAAGAKLPEGALGALEAAVDLTRTSPELRVALGDVQIRCAPLPDGFFSTALDLRLDRNACSALHAQDVVRIVAEWPNGMKLALAAYAFGWLPADAKLSPPIPERLEEAFVRGASVQVEGGDLVIGDGAARVSVPAGTRLPAADKQGRRAHVATADGFVTSSAKQAAGLRLTRRNLTRRALLEEAWRFIGTPYGLGDTDGGRDCSRLVLDAFDAFDLQLPRHSSWQAKAGSFWVDVQGVPEAERASLFDAAAKKGIALLYFPGHIMLYLGRNELGEPMVLHALGEFLEPCGSRRGAKPAPETLVRVKNITVSNLELGRGTSRTALLERVTRITVVGGTPGSELEGVAELRPVPGARIPSDKQCADGEKTAIYVMPEQPNKQQPLRVITAMNDNPGPAALTLVDPDGNRLSPEVVRLGGPPFGQVATIEGPKPGKWKAVFADGDNVIACQQIVVRGRRPKLAEPDEGPIWQPKYRWNVANENLYALFVERLFDYALEEDRTWTNLHSLLRDADRNLLFDYRGLEEDGEIDLAPDCADLPYALRAYFAWKMRLPFGYRRCTRGRGGRPPNCDEPGAGDNLMSRLELPGKGGPMQARDDIEAFELFLNTQLRSAVHSSSGRTSPADDLTDFYPIPLTREALKPGTVFADPYGHFLVLADWVPQGSDKYGMLVGVDAQPDGTIGQRRFWRGTFLFDPDTKGGGAGFKAFRPRLFVEEPLQVPAPVEEKAAAAELSAEPEPAALEAAKEPALIERVGFLEDVENKDLRGTRRYTRFSMQQYKGSADDFYATLEALINPRPLEPKAVLRSLVDALAEAVGRRVISVSNGEKWLGEHDAEVIEMPEGESIFLSSGPWEDFSTPSRDLRLLISIDTVLGFSGRVRAAPARFLLRKEELDEKSAELDAVLRSELGQRTFKYMRSDGSAQQLSLQDVVTRAALFEAAYNPNDCNEVRWAAPPGSAEMATCRRRAPPEQQAKMESYRHWFSTRKRPPQ